jgi:hypothetical protein
VNALRDLLDLAAGPAPAVIPGAAIRRRAAVLTRRRRVAAVASLAVLLALTMIGLPRLSDAPPAPSDLPATTVTPGTLAPGRWTADVMGQQLTFTTPKNPPWVAAAVTSTRLLLTSPSTTAEIDVMHWTAVHTVSADGLPQKATVAPPDDLVAWLVDHPGIGLLAPPTPTTLGGRPAHRLTIAVRLDYLPTYDPARPGQLGCVLPDECITLADAPEQQIVLYSGTSMELVVQDTPGPDRLVAVSASLDGASSAVEAARDVVTSFAID